ncbi:MAG: hypothetical protein ACM3PU_02740, partial [Gemmatimonadota bacterium]
GGAGAPRVFATIAQLAGREPVATLALTDRQIDGGSDDRLDEFVQRLKVIPRRRTAHAPRRTHAAHAAG